MSQRERINDRNQAQTQQPAAPVMPNQNLNATREAAERFLTAGDDAINRALSGNSENFLAANTQEGGQ
jgi:hypothetical protein